MKIINIIVIHTVSVICFFNESADYLPDFRGIIAIKPIQSSLQRLTIVKTK